MLAQDRIPTRLATPASRKRLQGLAATMPGFWHELRQATHRCDSPSNRCGLALKLTACLRIPHARHRLVTGVEGRLNNRGEALTSRGCNEIGSGDGPESETAGGLRRMVAVVRGGVG